MPITHSLGLGLVTAPIYAIACFGLVTCYASVLKHLDPSVSIGDFWECGLPLLQDFLLLLYISFKTCHISQVPYFTLGWMG